MCTVVLFLVRFNNFDQTTSPLLALHTIPLAARPYALLMVPLLLMHTCINSLIPRPSVRSYSRSGNETTWQAYKVKYPGVVHFLFYFIPSLTHSLPHTLPPPYTPSLIHSLPHTLPPSYTPSYTPSPIHSLIHSLPHTLAPSYTPSPIHSLPHTLPPSYTPSPIHSLPHALPPSYTPSVYMYTYIAILSVCLYIIVNQLPISWPIRDIYVRMLARKKLKLNTDTTEDLPSFYPSTSPSSRSPVALALTPAKPGPSLSHTPSTKAGTNS